MNKIFYFFRFVCVALIFALLPALGIAKTVKVVYSDGLAEADGRDAYLELTIGGRQVSGKMVANGVCKENIRLPKTSLTFKGNLSGNSWEDLKSQIIGSWTGGDYGCDGKLMIGYPTKGSLRIKILPGNSLDKAGSVYLTRITSSTYGYLFKSRGVKYFPDKQEPEDIPPWVENPSNPGRAVLQLNNSASTDYGPVGPPASSYIMPSFRNSDFKGVVALSYKEIRNFYVNCSAFKTYWDERNEKKKISAVSKVTLDKHFVTSNLKVISASTSSVNVQGDKEGAGQVWMEYHMDFLDEKGVLKKGVHKASWYVLVGQAALAEYQGKIPQKPRKESPRKSDITKVTITGKAIRQGSHEPASSARIYLVPQMNEEVCTSREDGGFRCTFSKQQSGRYELMIQKPSGREDLPPIEAAELDLWPIKRYMVELTPKKASAGPIDVGTIWMERIGILCGNANLCRVKEEVRGESSVSKSEQESRQYENKGDDLANSGEYQQALEFYDKSLKSTDDSARKEKLHAKILALKKKIDISPQTTLNGNWSEGTHGIWTFDPTGHEQYQAHFRGEVNVDGPAQMQGPNLTITIQYTKIEVVQYTLVLSEDGQSLTGQWTAKKAGRVRTKQTVLKRAGIAEKSPIFKGISDDLWGGGEEMIQQPGEDGYQNVLDY